jgi:tetratricopeptide (TPR) repeat protein
MTPDGKPGRNSADNYELDRAVVPVSMIPTACCIFRKTDVLFDERYLRAGWEDTDFFTQLHEKLGGQIAIANLVPVVHRNDEKNNGGAGNQENRRLYLSKWRGRLEAARPEESVQALLARGDFASAIPLLERQVAGGKVDGELLNNLGYACWQLGERGRAVDFFMQAAFLDPTNQDSLSNFFAASYETKQFDRLEQYLGLMREGNPAIGEYSYLLAQCLAEQGKQAEARQVLVELAAVDPAHPGAAELGERLATATVAL